MMLRNLSWANWKENMKRRNWTAVLCMVILLFLLPIRSVMEVSRMRSESYFAALTAQEQMKTLVLGFENSVSTSLFLMGAGVCFGFLFAVQGFHWLFSRRKTDLYLSVPVSAKRRFFLIYVNGVSFYVVSYLTALILAWITGGALGVLTPRTVGISLLAFVIHMAGFLAAYHIGILSVMLSGNLLVTMLGYGVLCVYEPALRYLNQYLHAHFYKTYTYRTDGLTFFFASPILNYAELNSMLSSFSNYGETDWLAAVKGLLLLLAWIVVLGALSYQLYRKRPVEAYHRALAFPVMKGVLRILLLVPFSLMAGCWFRILSGENTLFFIIGMGAGLLLGHCLIQLVYETDLRAIWKKKGQVLLAGVLVALVFVTYQYDLTGYDSYLPELDKIESVAIEETGYDEFYYYTDAFTGKDGYSWYRQGQQLDQMKTADPALLGALVQLVQADRHLQSREDYADGDYVKWDVRYRLKGGRSVYRKIRFQPETLEEAVNTVYRNEAYQNARYQIYAEDFGTYVGRMEASYSDGVREYRYSGDMERLLEVFREDFRTYDFTMIRKSLPQGKLTFCYYPDETEKEVCLEWSYPVYGDFMETLELLADTGTYEKSKNGSGLQPEEVAYIIVSNDNQMTSGAGSGTAVDYDYQYVEETFQEREEIAQILPALYPASLYQISGTEVYEYPRETSLGATVELNREALKRAPGVADWDEDSYFYVLEGKIPQFVWDRTRPESE